MALSDQLSSITSQADELSDTAKDLYRSYLRYLGQGRPEVVAAISTELAALDAASRTLLSNLYTIRRKVMAAIETQGP
jgi:hypothetical protein